MPTQMGLFEERLPPSEIPDILEKMPKLDLHRHLLGGLSSRSVREIALKNGIELPSESENELDELLTFSSPVDGLKAFFKPWPILSRLLFKPSAVVDVVYAALKEASEDNVIYAELRATWGMTGREPYGLDTFLKNLKIGLDRAELDFKVTGRVILGITRHLFSRHSWVERRRLWTSILDAACKYRGSVVVGFDVSGIEDGYPATLFTAELHEAQSSGFPLTIHCGETTPSSFIWQTVRQLAPKRIGHALSAIADPDLLVYIRDKGIAIESCPTTNWLTRTVTDISQHPLKVLHQRGVPVTINTDNPCICRTTLSREYSLLHYLMDVPWSDVEEMRRNSQRFVFADPVTFGTILTRMEETPNANLGATVEDP